MGGAETLNLGALGEGSAKHVPLGEMWGVSSTKDDMDFG